MDGFSSHFVSLHDIDVKSNTANGIDMKSKQDLELFMSGIFKKRLRDKKAKKFREKEDSRVIACVKEIEEGIGDRQVHLDKIASFLLDAEKDVKSATLKKGILVQSLLKYEEDIYYLLAKVEPGLFLDQSTWKKQSGFPYEKHVLKSCLIKFVKNPSIEKIVLYDSNRKIADYWWDDFLELEKVNSVEENIKKSLKAIETEVDENLKEKFSDDSEQLKEEVKKEIYEKKSAFKVQDVISVFKNHKPSSPDLKMDQIVEKIEKLPEANKFDEEFILDEDIVDKTIKRVIPLTPQIELTLNASVQDLGTDICIGVNPKGGRYLKIKVKNGFGLPDFPVCHKN